jgi:tetratricopeptide (TPR) repeat protein
MINELSGRRLLSDKKTSSDETAYTIHRLLQQKILLDMEDFGFADAFRKAFRLIRKRFPAADPQQVPNPHNWEECQEYLPHVSTFWGIYQQTAASATLGDPTPLELAELFYDAGFYIWARQTPSYNGLSFLESAEKILDDIKMNPYAKIRADILCATGLLLLNLGCVERRQGLDRLKDAWEIRKQIFDQHQTHDNDVLRQNAANDYSLCLLNEHQFDEAGAMIRGCREQYLVWGPESENPFENSKYYGNYSIVLMVMGEMDKAIESQQHAIMLTERFSGKKAMYYRRSFLLACILLQAGDVQAAVDKHLEVLNARLEIHGKHNEYTIASMYAVGAMYHHLGDAITAT